MKKSFFFLAMAAGLLAACNSENSEKKTADSTELIAEDTTFTATKPAEGNSTECYAYVKNRDTVSMKLNIAGEEYTGELNYRFFEKDKSKGTFAGEMKGDTLIAEYTFDAEGMRSVREVVFLRKGSDLVEGFGDIEEKGSKVVFKDRSKLTFGDAVVLAKVSCN
ncbi:MAG TPA: hypothetical protein VK541_02330 [Pedobacter sp.]|uniref:hypothetical protein n=1 Tax=Pedobacter sp. TaxID=1411316 RepID=UPI002B925C04|nr:hypothetical protein [Pedobacter sp.]HMI01288.1 hypothetical protein [Pedobacter sp.]